MTADAPTPDDGFPADMPEILKRNIRNVNRGLTHADVIVKGMILNDVTLVQLETTELLEWMRTLDDDALQQLALTALTTAIQYRNGVHRG